MEPSCFSIAFRAVTYQTRTMNLCSLLSVHDILKKSVLFKNSSTPKKRLFLSKNVHLRVCHWQWSAKVEGRGSGPPSALTYRVGNLGGCALRGNDQYNGTEEGGWGWVWGGWGGQGAKIPPPHLECRARPHPNNLTKAPLNLLWTNTSSPITCPLIARNVSFFSFL